MNLIKLFKYGIYVGKIANKTYYFERAAYQKEVSLLYHDYLPLCPSLGNKVCILKEDWLANWLQDFKKTRKLCEWWVDIQATAIFSIVSNDKHLIAENYISNWSFTETAWENIWMYNYQILSTLAL